MEWICFFFLFIILAVSQERRAKRKRIKEACTFKPENAHGGARFATYWDLFKAGLFKCKGVPIGYFGWRALHYSGPGHILTIAAARTGKGATLLVNALLSWKSSCISIDPKCENCSITAHFRRRFGKVFVLNPFGMLLGSLKGLKLARFNPMDVLNKASSSFHAYCDKLAAALAWEEGSNGFHFVSGARTLISGVMASVVRHGQKAEQNLPAVAKIICGDIRTFCRLTVESTNDPFIIAKLSRFAYAKADDKEIEGVIATARVQLAFLLNEAIAYSLSGSDFRFSDLKKWIITVYICLPLNMLDVCDKYFRLIMEVALLDLLDEGQKGKGKRVLFMIDELAQLGPHMKSLENAMGMAAGAAGIQLWCVLQDLSQLMGMFPKTWSTFVQNCAVFTIFGARDQTTREYVSKLAGTTEVLTHSRSVSIDHQTGEPHVNDSANQCARPLLLPHEVGQIGKDEMIAFVEGVTCGPIKAKRRFYWRVFPGRARKNPYHS